MVSHLQLIVYLAMCLLLVILVVFMLRRYRATAALRRASRLVSGPTGVPSYRSSLPRLNQELDRARRYLHTCTLVILNPQTDSLQKSEVALPQLLALSLVGSMARDALRAMDILAFDSTHNEYVLLLPESSQWQAVRAVQRLQELARERAGVRLQAGMAEFPTDGLTVEQLISASREAAGLRPRAEISLGSTIAASSDDGRRTASP